MITWYFALLENSHESPPVRELFYKVEDAKAHVEAQLQEEYAGGWDKHGGHCVKWRKLRDGGEFPEVYCKEDDEFCADYDIYVYRIKLAPPKREANKA